MNAATTIQWDPLNREQHRVLANGGAISHTWDAAGREVLLENRNAAGVGQAIFTNTYDPLSNRLSVIELDNTRVSYSYDPTSQLLTEARSGTFAYNRSYVWDSLGNRLQQYDSGVLTQRTFNAANAMLTIVPASGSPTTQVFDANGNLTLSTTGSAVTTNTWSAANQLLSQVSPTVNEQYLYSQDGMRQQKVNSTGTTKFTLDGPNVLLETTTAGALQARNTQYPNGYGGLVSQNRGSASSYYGFDSQQSTRILVSVGGTITDSLSFKAFGEELQTGSGTVNPFWFGGQVGYFRDLPGVMNLGWRKLIAANGVFLNRDLVGFAGGDVNLMRFVGNNPVTRVDPLGTDPECYVSQFSSTYTGPETVSVTSDGSGGYYVEMFITRISKARVTCRQCPCSQAPSVAGYSFYQWKKGYEADVNVTTGEITWPPPNWPNWVCDQSPGSKECTYYTLPNPPKGVMVPLAEGCLWEFDFYTCDQPGIKKGGQMKEWKPNCERVPPPEPDDIIASGIGQVGPHTFNGKQWVRDYCTGFGKSGADALKIGVPWGLIYGFAESKTSGPNPYFNSWNSDGCPTKP